MASTLANKERIPLMLGWLAENWGLWLTDGLHVGIEKLDVHDPRIGRRLEALSKELIAAGFYSRTNYWRDIATPMVYRYLPLVYEQMKAGGHPAIDRRRLRLVSNLPVEPSTSR